MDDCKSNAEMLGTSSYCLGPVPSTVPSILSFAPWRSQHPSASIARYKAHLPRVGWCWAPSVGVRHGFFPTCTTKATVLTSTIAPHPKDPPAKLVFVMRKVNLWCEDKNAGKCPWIYNNMCPCTKTFLRQESFIYSWGSAALWHLCQCAMQRERCC